MPEFRMRLEICRAGGDEPIKTVEATVLTDHEPTPRGEYNLGNELVAEFRKAIRYHECVGSDIAIGAPATMKCANTCPRG